MSALGPVIGYATGVTLASGWSALAVRTGKANLRVILGLPVGAWLSVLIAAVIQ